MYNEYIVNLWVNVYAYARLGIQDCSNLPITLRFMIARHCLHLDIPNNRFFDAT